jgi:kynurenine formamidase
LREVVDIVDLSMEIKGDTPVYPGDPIPKIKSAANISEDGYNVSHLDIGSHTGTHVDAPFHFQEKGLMIDEIDLNRFVGNGIIIDVTHKLEKEAIMLDDVAGYLPKIKSGTIVLFKTGWSKYANEKRYFDHPYIHLEVINKLLESGVRTFLIDALNIDPPDGSSFAGHDAITNVNGIIGENLTNLEAIDFLDPFIMALPLKLKGGDGSPVRAVAIRFKK